MALTWRKRDAPAPIARRCRAALPEIHLSLPVWRHLSPSGTDSFAWKPRSVGSCGSATVQAHFMMRKLSTLLEDLIPSGDDLPVPLGILDGVTIMRYAHVYRERVSGGVEQYLRHLNQGLLQRHRMTILQMHLVRDEADDAIEIESVGIGRILWVPVDFRQMDNTIGNLPRRIGYICRRSLRMSQKEGKGRLRAIFSSIQSLASHRGGHLRYGITIFSDRLSHLLVTQNVDLLALHWLTYDTGALILRARKARVPFVLINHFNNARWSLPRTRKCIAHAAAIGGVSAHGVSDNLRNRYVNLSDAVDTEFFAPEKARPKQPPARPIVLLPGRIQAGKGHHDLMEAARILFARKVNFVLCFAGAVDSEPLHQELRRSAAAMGLERRILFLGERSAEEIRDWYALSSMVVLPSYSEGLPRVLLEAQAMKRPVLAYDCGGMSEAVLQNETGFLVKTGNVEALADKISFLLENEAERLRIGERGRELVCRHFSFSALVQRHEIFYLRALSGARAKGNGTFPGR